MAGHRAAVIREAAYRPVVDVKGESVFVELVRHCAHGGTAVAYPCTALENHVVVVYSWIVGGELGAKQDLIAVVGGLDLQLFGQRCSPIGRHRHPVTVYLVAQ